jgi:hypothetical protein
MSSPLADMIGELMELADYYADFERNFWRSTSFWKLERGQTFAEPGNASWEAFGCGDWDKSLQLLEAERPALQEYHERVAAIGSVARRVRIVEFPITPYLQWELHALAIRDECGGPVRVLRATDIADLETGGLLPDVHTIGDEVMYEAVYDSNGVLEAAYRFDDRDAVHRCRDFIVGLFERAESLAEFFPREVAPLPPPPPVRRLLPDRYLERSGRPRPIRS